MAEVAAGIDIGGTNTEIGLVDKKGKILARGKVSTRSHAKPEALVEAVSACIDELKNGIGKSIQIIGAGIGAPNGNFFKGTIEFAPNLEWKGIIPLSEMFEKKLDCKSLLTNDANAAALGEMLFGAARGMNDFLFVTLGTGLGSGIVSGGKLIYGHDGFAGELGHVIVRPDGRPCGCGRKGCLETYCSATGIVKTYEGRKAGAKDSLVDAHLIYERAMEGEKEAIASFNQTGEWLGLALANSVAYTSPESIFLFGGLANAGDLIFKPTIDSFEKNLLHIYRDKIKILPSGLKENEAAILGAASLIWNSEK